MKDLTLRTPRIGLASGRRSFFDDLARRSVISALKNLEQGAIVLEDGEDTVTLGKPEGGLSSTIRVHNPKFYSRVMWGSDLGAAESFIEGEWSSDDLSLVLRLFARELRDPNKTQGRLGSLRGLAERPLHFLRRNSVRGSARNIHAHYDLGNPFFELFLDETMNYSSGIFDRPQMTMAEASMAKMDRACLKLRLKDTDHLLEIGTGWGALAIHAASRYGCRVTTTTISQEQFELASQRVRAAGLESRIQVLKQDYRSLAGQFDKLVSIEMIEAVGHDFLDVYFSTCRRLLKADGLMLLQAIVTPDYRYEASRRSVDFIRRYIFPGSCLLSVGRISAALARVTDFRTLHVEDIGPHYAETLRRWREKFRVNLDAVRALGYDERFIRMWDYYLSYCEAGFEERIIGDVQMLFERPASRVPPVLGLLRCERSERALTQ